MVTADPVNPVVAAGRSVAVAAIRALSNDSESDWDALTALMDETSPEVLWAGIEELALLFVAVAGHLTVAEARFLSKPELERLWSAAIQGAARARFPKQGVALREAAYLTSKLVLAERIPEDRARAHMEKATARAGLRPAEAARRIEDASVASTRLRGVAADGR